MKDRIVFEFKDYKKFMSYKLIGEKQRGQLSRAAEALNCQRSYLSRVINEELHITPDHAFKLSIFLKLNTDEQEYFQTLVDLGRGADREYCEFLNKKLISLRKKFESIQERTQRTQFTIEENQARYFSSWIWSAIHFLTCIADYQTAEAVSERLGIKKEIALKNLKYLEQLGFVKNENSKWIYNSGEFHAAKDSSYVIQHHQNWRQRAVLDAVDIENTNVHYTGVHTLNKKDFEYLKLRLLDLISEISLTAGPSNPEEAIAITLDMFSI